jgi:hypothetical protein
MAEAAKLSAQGCLRRKFPRKDKCVHLAQGVCSSASVVSADRAPLVGTVLHGQAQGLPDLLHGLSAFQRRAPRLLQDDLDLVSGNLCIAGVQIAKAMGAHVTRPPVAPGT